MRQGQAADDGKSRPKVDHLTVFPGADPDRPIRRKQATLARDRADYWKARLKRRATAGRESGDYYVRISHNQKQRWVNLHTGNKGLAAERARAFWVKLVAEGWDQAMLTLEAPKPEPEPEAETLTVGKYIEAVTTYGNLRASTQATYLRKFRTLIGDIAGIEAGVGCKASGWQKVDALPLSILTPEAIKAWRAAYMARRSPSSELERSAATRTLNSIVRNARALFSRDIREAVSGIIGEVSNPFEGIRLKGDKVAPFKSTVTSEALLDAAKEELREEKPGQWLVLLLGLLAGLRKSEIDRLTWGQVRAEDGAIRIEPTQWFSPKSDESQRDVPIAETVLSEILSHREGSSPFLIPGPERIPSHPSKYRCARTFNALSNWLRDKGLTSRTPIHELRKMYGSSVNNRYGLLAASRALGHAGVEITARVYTEANAKPVLPVDLE